MLRTLFKTAVRNLARHRVFTLLNVVGLSTGLACSLLIWLWVRHELSFDRYPDVYRVTARVLDQEYPLTGAPLAEALKTQVPGVVETARIKGTFGGSTVFTVGNKYFEEKRAFFADPSLLRMFSLPLVSGDPATALVAPDGLLLTEHIAKKYFGDKNPVGETIRMGDKDVFKVTGVLKDMPSNTHLQVDILLPMSFDAKTDGDILNHHWDNLNFYTYVQLDPAKAPALQRQINQIYAEADASFKADIALQPVDRIHLYSTYPYDITGHGDIRYVRIFSLVALIILLVACINFMNLATARSARRAKEVGVRKVIGAPRWQLIAQFLGESAVVTFLSLLAGLVLLFVALPFFNDALGTTLSVDFAYGWILLGVFLLTALVAGSYPALFLSGFKPVKVLKGTATPGQSSTLFRNGLVVFQFVVSIVLMVGTLVVYSQLRYIRERDPGFNKTNLLYARLKGDLGRHIDALAAQMNTSPRLGKYTVVSEIPVNLSMGTAGVHWEGKDPNSLPMFSVMGVDTATIDVFGMHLVSGRNFSTAYPTDSLNYIVNESALRVLGWDARTAVGKPLQVWDNKGVVIGVIHDFNFKPVQSAVDPLIFKYNPGPKNDWLRRMVVVQTSPAGIGDLRAVMTRLNPNYDADYGFVDQQLSAQYQAEQRLGFLFNTFAVLAIFISCLGLGGLAAFTAEQRTKEIGIRKVLGASVQGIVALLSRGFLRLVGVSFALAAPIAYYCMQRWLGDYAFRIQLSAWFFVAAGGAAVLIALATVSIQAARAAIVNPVKSLKNE
ncbi:ABC transporter permease [Dinghuibacter silviterrae]|uniref:FtsX-like permease family protein n=1 Tax=Dinghuibacter silviterrae TaxID=1539049 RepID=A0A4R8DVA0_9BACT|nr:ABC transporter permease [Dinghuibacter silviterrae]TDX02350.1 FtsX-like permease family protein [Dinghuibacter silviterrae]